MRILKFFCSLARFDLANRGVRQPSRAHSVLDCSYSTRHQRSLILQLQIALTQWWAWFTPLFSHAAKIWQLWTLVS